MASDKSRADLAEKISKHSDLSVNAVLRTFYSLEEHGIDVTTLPIKEPPVKRSSESAPAKPKVAGAAVPPATQSKAGQAKA